VPLCVMSVTLFARCRPKVMAVSSNVVLGAAADGGLLRKSGLNVTGCSYVRSVERSEGVASAKSGCIGGTALASRSRTLNTRFEWTPKATPPHIPTTRAMVTISITEPSLLSPPPPPAVVKIVIAVGGVVNTAVGAAVGSAVGEAVGVAVGSAVGDRVGRVVGDTVGRAIGDIVGVMVGSAVGALVGDRVGERVLGALVGILVGERVLGALVGGTVGGTVGCAVGGRRYTELICSG
jgi:hypothetical protein